MFSSYEKIDEGFLGRGLTQEHYRLIQKTDWVVTEKIHGANFCVILDSQQLRYAKRKEILSEEDDFFGYQAVVRPLEPGFREVQQWLHAESFASVQDTILLYGELCGGGYPHPEVEPDPLVDLIQSGIYYSPNVEFCVFDIAIHTPELNKTYLDYSIVSDVCTKAGLLYTHALFIGNYDEALHFDIRFESTLPAMLGLPRLPFPNLAEGVVIKPARELRLTTAKESFRPLLKHKIREFSEVQFHQSEKWNAFEPKGKVTRLIRDVLRLVNQNRLTNAASKVGRIRAGDVQKIAQVKRYFQEDMEHEIQQQFAKALTKLTHAEKETVTQHWQAALEELLKNYLTEEKRL
jgi:Rnl2 family RNA ligase